MCNKHVPIVVYDSGGTYEVCENCGQPLSKWKPNGNGKKKNHDKSTEKKDKQEEPVHSW